MRFVHFLFLAIAAIFQPVFADPQFFLPPDDDMEYCNDDFCEAYEDDDDLEGWGRIILGGAYGKYIGLKHSYIEWGLMGGLPLCDHAQLFGDARGFYLSKSHWAESLGLGYRYFFENVCENHYEILGVNVYYDALQKKITKNICGHFEDNETTHHQHNFNRLGLGLEYLSTCFDLHVNGYLPVGKSSYRGKRRHFTFPGSKHGSCRSTVFLPWGVDGEIGTNNRFCDDYLNIYLGVGSYYYKHRLETGVTGVQARVELSWMDYLSLQFLYSYDHEFSSKYQGKIVFSLPFSTLRDFFCPCEEPCCYEFDPWQQGVKRNYVPFLDESCCWRWNW